MIDNVTKLTSAVVLGVDGRVADADVVEILELALEAARSGEIVGVFVGAVYANGCGGWQYGGLAENYTMVGALAVGSGEISSVLNGG